MPSFSAAMGGHRLVGGVGVTVVWQDAMTLHLVGADFVNLPLDCKIAQPAFRWTMEDGTHTYAGSRTQLEQVSSGSRWALAGSGRAGAAP